MDENLRIAEETDFDFVETSVLACQAFGRESNALSPERFRWTYRDGYDRVVVLTAYAGEEKIGQFASIVSEINIAGTRHKAAELIDLFVSPAHRRRAVIGGLYEALKAWFADQGIRHIFAFPNEKAWPLNRKYFGLDQFSTLPLRAGLRGPLAGVLKPRGFRIYADPAEFHDAYAVSFADSLVNWSRESLRRRLSSPLRSYICAGDDNLGLVCSPREIRGIKAILVCATFCNDPAAFSSRRATRLLSHICARQNAWIYLYAGRNGTFPFAPGFRLPKKCNGNKFIVQSNFLEDTDGIGKVELIDIDYG